MVGICHPSMVCISISYRRVGSSIPCLLGCTIAFLRSVVGFLLLRLIAFFSSNVLLPHPTFAPLFSRCFVTIAFRCEVFLCTTLGRGPRSFHFSIFYVTKQPHEFSLDGAIHTTVETRRAISGG